MYAYNDLTGNRYGKLLAIRPTDRRIKGKIVWECVCDCGNTHFVMGSRLISGRTKSCGCLPSALRTQLNTTHGGTGSRIFRIWTSMKTRCYNEKSKTFPYYGGRGIQVCDEWKNDFAAFRSWALQNGYQDNLTLDRIDGDEGYSPNNCRWATWHEQRMNQRRCKEAAPVQRERPQTKGSTSSVAVPAPEVKIARGGSGGY